MSDTPRLLTPMSVDENPPCKRCGFATEYAGFVSAPPTLIYKCDLCGFDTRIAGKPENGKPENGKPKNGKPKNGKPKTSIEPHGQQQQFPTKPEDQE